MRKEPPGSRTVQDNPFVDILEREIHINQRKELYIAVKTVDESVVNSTTLQNDDDLVIAVGANEVYFGIIFILPYAASSTPDIKFAFAVPTNGAIKMLTFNLAVPADYYDFTDTATKSLEADGSEYIWYGFLYTGGDTAGNLQFQWAQKYSSATATTLKAGSCLIAWKVN